MTGEEGDGMSEAKKPSRVVYRATTAQSDGSLIHWDYDDPAKRARHHRGTFSTVRILPKKPKLHDVKWALRHLGRGKVVYRDFLDGIEFRMGHSGLEYRRPHAPHAADREWSLAHAGYFNWTATDWQLAPEEFRK